MRADRAYLEGLSQIHRAPDAELRRALWRQSMATLAAEAAAHQPVPLEGLDPEEVLASVRAALSDGLIDDLGFLERSHAAAALYELAAVLPLGDERRELGRRVAGWLHQGDAATFVALATQLALGSRRGLSGPAVRARVALALDLPIGTGTDADALALALVSRRELAREWVANPATGSLPSRRLAARLLERAAREAARRVSQGDDAVLGVFERDSVKSAWDRLLGDREPLVWRHVAAARGLLAEASARFGDEILADLDPKLSPTQWRRAAASLATSIAVSPATALARAMALLEGPIFAKDPGLAGAMVLGLPRAAEVEPDAAEELCVALVRAGGIDAAEALLWLRQERVGGDFGVWASQMARARLREKGLAESDDEGLAALAGALDQELRHAEERDGPPTLRMRLEAALLAFAKDDARQAYDLAHEVLGDIEVTLRRLESLSPDSPEGRRDAFLALRELDSALLETSTLADLLTLGSRSADGAATAPLAGFFERLTDWLLRQEREPIRAGEEIVHRTLRMHRLRTLLHAVDADGVFGGEARQAELRARRLRTAHALLARVRDDAPSPLRRIVTAAAARACDALLREDVGELSDIFHLVVRHVSSPEGLETMAEASMVPEMESVFIAYAALIEAATQGSARASVAALRGLTRAFPTAESPRVDALHAALVGYAEAVEQVEAARSLAELRTENEGESRVASLERASRQLARLGLGTLRRLGDGNIEGTGVVGPALRLVDLAVDRALRGERDAMGEALAGAIDALHEDLPDHLAELAGNSLVRALTLPEEADPAAPARDSFRPAAPKEAPLPRWLPPSRVLGGFYVLRALGSGAVGSVFVARRLEERRDEEAPRFALKVPEYSGAAARTLGEGEFLQLFREEAGALLAIPHHENLAQLVTFDAGAKPKPILVMELVEGPTLERALDVGALSVAEAFSVLDGIAAGVDAMHGSGVGHLDLKPSNVILRDGDVTLGRAGTPVLVDFGLAGRNVRPGCATANYGAPEIWGLLPKGVQATPSAADVYAFGCLSFEVLTARELVSGTSELSIITNHLSHDGDFQALAWLAQDPMLAPLAEIIAGAVRQDLRTRVPIRALRRQLAELAPKLADRPWPLSV